MAVESPPEAGAAIWLRNFVPESAIAAYTNAATNYPADHLLLESRSDSWRSTDDSTNTSVVFDCATAEDADDEGRVIPTCLALVGARSVSRGSYIRFRGSDDSAQVTNPVYFDLPLYELTDDLQVLRWYLGTPTFGSMDSGRRYWGIRILPTTFGSYNTPDGFFEIATPWIGTYEPVRLTSARHNPENDSAVAKAHGGALWTDTLPTYEQVDVEVGWLTFAQYYALKAKLKAQALRHVILDQHAGATDADVKRGSALYGTLKTSPYSGDATSPVENTLRLSFEEARG